MTSLARESTRPTLHGQRLCSACFHNLRHQPILRDDELNLSIIRCPECGLAAALGTVPVLGRFERTLARLLAAAWTAALIVLGVGSIYSIYGACVGAGYVAPDFSAVAATAGSATRLTPAAWAMLGVAAGLGAALGALWRIILVRSRAAVQRIVPIVILCAAMALTWQEVSDWFEYSGFWNEGLRDVGAPMVVFAGGALVVAYAAGAVFAFPAARWCYRRLLLPRRLQLMLPL